MNNLWVIINEDIKSISALLLLLLLLSFSFLLSRNVVQTKLATYHFISVFEHVKHSGIVLYRSSTSRLVVILLY